MPNVTAAKRLAWPSLAICCLAAGALAHLTSGVADATSSCNAVAQLGNVGPKVALTKNGANTGTADDGTSIAVMRGGSLSMTLKGARYLLFAGSYRLACRPVAGSKRALAELVLTIQSGRITVATGAGEATVVTPNALALARRAARAEITVRAHGTDVRARSGIIELRSIRQPRLQVRVRRTQTGTFDRQGMRLDIYPFSVSPLQRPVTRADSLPHYWADGQACSVGCLQPGVQRGWPLKPFHRQHALRAGLNELRPSGMHVGIDIEARDGQEAYALSSGRAHLLRVGTVDEAVQVGQLIYWHIHHQVGEGQFVTAYRTPLGRIHAGFRHLHFSEMVGGEYLNPLRPGGRSLVPYADTEAPVIGVPRIVGGGNVIVSVFDPQSYVDTDYQYHTPVLAPAAVAWRLYDDRNRALTPLEWALRGSHHLPDSAKNTVYAPGATNPGFWCFIRQRLCKPVWRYRLAGGLAPPLPVGALAVGHTYRLTVYAEDWAGNQSALDYRFKWSSRYRRMIAPSEVGAPAPRYEP